MKIVKTALIIRPAFGAVVLLAGIAAAFGQEAPVPPVPPEPPQAFAAQEPPQAPAAPRAPRPPREVIRVMSRDREDRDYQAGQSALNRHDYDRAIEAFNRVVEQKNRRTEGALYWRAYAENRLGKRDQALATLAQLRKEYAASRWLDDAKALEVEVRQAAGSSVSPENTTDEEMKIMILNGMVNTDPERTLPLLEKLLKGNNSPKVKERALFVLAQSRSQKGRELIAQVAKGSYNPDLQSKAVEYLGVFGGRENGQLLADIYKNNSDPQLRRSIIRSFMISSNREALLTVAKTETNPDLRVEAIRQLGVMGGAADLLQLYTPDAAPEVKKAILQGLFVSGQADKILEIARSDKDPAMRREAIRQLGPMGRKSNVDMAGLYAKETDPANKREVLNALFIQGNAAGIIEIAKKETNPELKREAVQKLSIMHSKESTDYLLELLNK